MFSGSDWFICYFRVLGKSFRGDFWSVLTGCPGSFRSIVQTKFPEQIAENPFKTVLACLIILTGLFATSGSSGKASGGIFGRF